MGFEGGKREGGFGGFGGGGGGGLLKQMIESHYVSGHYT